MGDSKAVVKPDSNQLAAELNDELESMAGMGGENVTTDDMQIPFLAIAQALSPEVNKNKPEFIKGMEQGDFFNKATGRFYKGDGEGIKLIPVLFQMQYIEWTPRDKGGGYNGTHSSSILEACEQDEKGTYWLPNGNLIAPTATWLMLILDDNGDFEQVVLSLSSTQLKKSKKLITSLKSIRLPSAKKPGTTYEPPFFYNVLRATSVPESNDQGSWYGWKFELAGNVTQFTSFNAMMRYAKESHEAFSTGKTRAAFETQADQPSGQTIDGEPRRRVDDGEDIPF